MWVWDRSIGLWLWGVFQPNQEIKCLFAQLDRPTTNQSNVVCDYSSGGSLACFCVYWTKKFRMSPDVSGTRRAQAALLPGARYEPRVSPVRGPGAPRPPARGAARSRSPARGPGAPHGGSVQHRMKPALTIWLVWSSVHHRIKLALTIWLVWLVFVPGIIFPQQSDARPNCPSKQCCGRG